MNCRGELSFSLVKKVDSVGNGRLPWTFARGMRMTCGLLVSRSKMAWILDRLERVFPLKVDAVSAKSIFGEICWRRETQP